MSDRLDRPGPEESASAEKNGAAAEAKTHRGESGEIEFSPSSYETFYDLPRAEADSAGNWREDELSTVSKAAIPAAKDSHAALETAALKKKRLGPLQSIIWTVILSVLAVAAVASVLVTLHLKLRPESPFSYHLLRLSGNAPALERFGEANRPAGEFYGARETVELTLNEAERNIENLNRLARRNYLYNYPDIEFSANYLHGEFIVLRSRQLTTADFFRGGIAVLAQSVDDPRFIMEYLLPIAQRTEQDAGLEAMQPGAKLRLRQEPDANVMLHLHREGAQFVLASVIPLTYGQLQAESLPEIAVLTPPGLILHPARFPVLRTEFIDYLNSSYPEWDAEVEGDEELVMPTLFPASPDALTYLVSGRAVGLDAVLEDVQLSGALTEAMADPPGEAALAAMSEQGADTGTELTPIMVDSEPQILPVAEMPAADEMDDETDEDSAAAVTSANSWTLYKPGRMPRGRLLNLAEASRLAGVSLSGDPYYIQGDFVVSKSGKNRAVMRLYLDEEKQERRNPSDLPPVPVRLIVDFPEGVEVPDEEEIMRYTPGHPLHLQRVTASEADGQLNFYLREIVAR